MGALGYVLLRVMPEENYCLLWMRFFGVSNLSVAACCKATNPLTLQERKSLAAMRFCSIPDDTPFLDSFALFYLCRPQGGDAAYRCRYRVAPGGSCVGD